LALGVSSAANRNEYQEQKKKFWGVQRDRLVKADNLTAIYEPIVYDNVESSTFHNPIGLHGQLRGELYFYLFYFYMIYL
jgi:hypothetical protein